MKPRALRWLCCLLAWLAFAGSAVAEASSSDRVPGDAPQVEVYFFWSETCPHCEAARPFIEAIPRDRPWVVLHSLEVSRHP